MCLLGSSSSVKFNGSSSRYCIGQLFMNVKLEPCLENQRLRYGFLIHLTVTFYQVI